MKLALVACLTATSVAAAAPDVASELHAFGGKKARELARPTAASDYRELAAVGPCTRPTPAQRERAHDVVEDWILHTNPGSQPTFVMEAGYGCIDRGGLVVAIQADLSTGQSLDGHWWILRVSGDHVQEVDSISGTPVGHFMEWAQESTLDVVALADLDHDGIADVVSLVDQREGGSSIHGGTLQLILSSTKKPRTLGGVNSAVALARGTTTDLVLEITDYQAATIYRCVAANATLTSCADAKRARRYVQAVAAADALVQGWFPDHDRLAAALDVLAAPAVARDRWLAAASPTPPARHAMLRIQALLATSSDHTLDERAAEQAAFDDELHAALGDALCPVVAGPTPPAVVAWLAAHHEPGATFPASCQGATGAYILAEVERRDDAGAVVRDSLMFVSAGSVTELTSVATQGEFRASSPLDPDATPLDYAFYLHGTAAIAVLDDNGKTLLAFSDGRPVARRAGDFARDDGLNLVITDRSGGRQTRLHVGDALAEVPAAVIARIEARARVAEAPAVLANTTEATLFVQRTEVVAALKALGADRALVAEVAGLTAP